MRSGPQIVPDDGRGMDPAAAAIRCSVPSSMVTARQTTVDQGGAAPIGAAPRRRVGHCLAVLTLALVSGLLSSCGLAGSVTHTELGFELGVGSAPGAGKVLVDRAGRTLYALVLDRRGTSRCLSFCAIQWPPVDVTQPLRDLHFGPGVRRSLVGEVRRPGGGGLQLTYNRWPLYSYRLDGGAGQATGEGDGMGLWYAMSPDGHMTS